VGATPFSTQSVSAVNNWPAAGIGGSEWPVSVCAVTEASVAAIAAAYSAPITSLEAMSVPQAQAPLPSA
jgi:hypothetical protein